MKAFAKSQTLYKYMRTRMESKGWNFESLDKATNGKTGFNGIFSGRTQDMKLGTILKILDVLDLELVVRIKERPPKRRPAAYVPTTVIPPSAASAEEEPQA